MLIALVTHRWRPRIGSRAWCKAWAKRAWTAPLLLRMLASRARVRWRGARMGPLSMLAGAVLDGRAARLRIGDRTSIGRVLMALHDAITIGDRVVINDGVRLLTGTHAVDAPDWPLIHAPIVIHDHAWIATAAVILPGVTIGRGAVVGAGAVVSRDVPDNGIVVGNPARLLPRRRCTALAYDPVRLLAPIEAWLGPPGSPPASAAADAPAPTLGSAP
jgi:acetyltransferase-like isoleucine patch superfamily enzyme